MLFNISYNDPEIERKINELVGKPFSIIDNFNKGGIGSPKLFITKCSKEIYNLLNVNNTLKYCNIELRPKGIIIGFKSRLDVYVLVIPYYKLVIFKPGNTITFHIDHHYISVDCSKNSKGVQKFIDKMELEKEKNTTFSPLNAY